MSDVWLNLSSGLQWLIISIASDMQWN